MRFRQLHPAVATLITILCISSFGQYSQYSQRSLLAKKVFYVTNGKINSASFWSLPLGKFDCTLNRYFPGEGKINIEAAVNFSLLSSGYIEGAGYGERGKTKADANFAIRDGDGVKLLELGQIDYIYNNGKKVRLTDGNTHELLLACEVNNQTVRRMKIMIWEYNKQYKELKHSKDVDMVRAFSFTREGAARALKAQKSL